MFKDFFWAKKPALVEGCCPTQELLKVIPHIGMYLLVTFSKLCVWCLYYESLVCLPSIMNTSLLFKGQLQQKQRYIKTPFPPGNPKITEQECQSIPSLLFLKPKLLKIWNYLMWLKSQQWNRYTEWPRKICGKCHETLVI